MEVFEIVDYINVKVTEKIQDWLMLEPESNQRIRIGYSIQVLLTEAEKLIVTLLLFTILVFWQEVCIIIAIIMSLRLFMGGIHRETTIGCMLQTSLTIGTIIILSRNWSFGKNVQVIVLFIAILEVWNFTPLPSKTRISYSKNQKLQFKLKAMTALVILQILLEYVSTKSANIICWSVTVYRIKKGNTEWWDEW